MFIRHHGANEGGKRSIKERNSSRTGIILCECCSSSERSAFGESLRSIKKLEVNRSCQRWVIAERNVQIYIYMYISMRRLRIYWHGENPTHESNIARWMEMEIGYKVWQNDECRSNRKRYHWLEASILSDSHQNITFEMTRSNSRHLSTNIVKILRWRESKTYSKFQHESLKYMK